MDFGRPHDHLQSAASKSNIRYLQPVTAATADGCTPEEREHNVTLDNEVIQAANQTAADMFLPHTGSNDDDKKAGTVVRQDKTWMLDASHYTERLTPSTDLIQEGDLVVIQQSFDKLDFVYCKRGEIYNNKNGHFHHVDFINQPFGTQLRSRKGCGYCYLLKPTPELWTRSLNHRTQVVHELDQSQVIFQLYLKPNDVVVESGTGSGAMSHAILRTIAPAGHLHTYEFNRHRSKIAQSEFEQHGLGHLVTVHHKDVCRGIVQEEEEEVVEDDESENSCEKADQKKVAGTPGFDLPGQSVDAVFLDLPEPWLAVPYAAYVLRPNARIASYSPCVEQTQRTVAALEEAGFHSIKTFEYRQQEHYVDEVEYESPPTKKRPKPTRHDIKNYPSTTAASAVTNSAEEDDAGGESGAKAVNGSETQSIDSSMASGGETDPGTTAVTSNDKTESPTTGGKRKKMLVARPFVMMRGHSAFLTFATTGNEKRPNPNDASNGKQFE